MRGRLARGRGGFSLIELLVATVILMTIMSALGVAMVYRQREYVTQRLWRRADEATRSALAVIETAVRNVGSNPANPPITFSAPGPLDPNPMGAGSWNNVRARADLNGDGDVADMYEDIRLRTANDTLYARWIAGGADEPAGFPVRSLAFAYFRHDGTQVTTAAEIGQATRMRVIVTAPVGTGTRTLRRTGWVFLRNRS